MTSQQTQGTALMVEQCLASVVDAGQTLPRQWVEVFGATFATTILYLPGSPHNCIYNTEKYVRPGSK